MKHVFQLSYKCASCGLLVRLSETKLAQRYHKDYKQAAWSIFNSDRGKVEYHHCYGNQENFGLVKLACVQYKGEVDAGESEEKQTV